ncbi:MAG TPA: hypothetical protein VFW68_08310 [Rhodocyclaceae bacterium]|nr:hypothetical protein [Rhodocyclaceae bacterium]
MFPTCPKCGHVRSPADQGEPGTCPACGLVFAKWIRRDSFVPPSMHKSEDAEDEAASRSGLTEHLLHLPNDASNLEFWGRIGLLVLLAVWGWRLAAMNYRDGEMGTSFMHAILLPIHEAGHVLFMPFGEFLTIAGGSLFQIALPLICAGAFLVRNRDPYGAAVGMWWCGTSFLDLAPYVFDAADPQLMLLGGHTGADGPHDWIFLLDTFNKIAAAHAYGAAFHGIGIAIMALSLAWAGGVLWNAHLSLRRMAAKIRA